MSVRHKWCHHNGRTGLARTALRIGNGASGRQGSIQASFVVGIGTTAGTNTFTAKYEHHGRWDGNILGPPDN